MEEPTVEKEEIANYIGQESGPAESATAGVVESSGLQVRAEVLVLEGRRTSLREWKWWRKVQPAPVRSGQQDPTGSLIPDLGKGHGME